MTYKITVWGHTHTRRHAHSHRHAPTHTHTHTHHTEGLSILAAEAGILVFLASALCLERGHQEKLSKSKGPLTLGWIHQGHKKQTVPPSPPRGADRSVVDTEAVKASESPRGGNLA